MTDISMTAAEFDRWLTRSEREARESEQAANDAFVAALKKQIARGREKVKAGTFTDQGPLYTAKWLRGEPIMSPCGSPAAMCVERGGAHNGAQVLK